MIGILLHGIGTLLIGWMALSVHRLVGRERGIDRRVIAALARERTLGSIGMVLIVAGLIVQVAAQGY